MDATFTSRRFTLPPYLLTLVLCLVATVLALAAVLARAEPGEATPDGEDGGLPPCESPASPPDVFYACLRNGTLRERLAAARRAPNHLPALYGDPDDADEDAAAEAAAADLLLVIRQEPDEWVSRTLLEALLPVGGDAVDGLYREVLDAGSINLLPVVLRRLAEADDPLACDALDDLWDRDLPGWMRPGLIAALAWQGSTTHLDDFVRLTREGDDETRLAAIKALGLLGCEGGREALLAAARAGPPWSRARALWSLVDLPYAATTLAEALRASHGGPRVLQEAAIDALRRLQDDEADARLIALLDEPLAEHLRAAAAVSLENSAHAGATDALVRLAHVAGPGSCLRTAALRALYNRDDPAAVSGLFDLQDGSGQGPFPSAAMLIEHLSRERADGSRRYLGSRGCPDNAAADGAGDSDPERARPWRVDPPPQLATARCWGGPDLAGDPDALDRIPAGTPVRITDHFERPAGEWVHVEGERADCWLPLSQVARDAGARPAEKRRSLPRIELDIWRRDLESLPVARLVAAGDLEVIEPGEEVVGVALSANPADREHAAFLRAIQDMLPEEGAWRLRSALERLLKQPRSVDGSLPLP